MTDHFGVGGLKAFGFQRIDFAENHIRESLAELEFVPGFSIWRPDHETVLAMTLVAPVRETPVVLSFLTAKSKRIDDAVAMQKSQAAQLPVAGYGYSPRRDRRASRALGSDR